MVPIFPVMVIIHGSAFSLRDRAAGSFEITNLSPNRSRRLGGVVVMVGFSLVLLLGLSVEGGQLAFEPTDQNFYRLEGPPNPGGQVFQLGVGFHLNPGPIQDVGQFIEYQFKGLGGVGGPGGVVKGDAIRYSGPRRSGEPSWGWGHEQGGHD